MPYKVGKKTKTKGWPILEYKKGSWKVIAHSDSKEKAKARYAPAMHLSIIKPENGVLYSNFHLRLTRLPKPDEAVGEDWRP